jgi:hypothetical protein
VRGAARVEAAAGVALVSAWVMRAQGRRLKRADSPGACIALLAATGKWLAVYGLLLGLAISWRG